MSAISLILWCLLIGSTAGLLAGLLGVGGGLIVVPALSAVLAHTAPAAPIAHIAVATSLASIFFTGLSSAWQHQRLGHIDRFWVLQLAPAILIGTVIGSVLAAWVSGAMLNLAYLCFALWAGWRMWRKAPAHPQAKNRLPPVPAGGLIGMISAWVGIGGGTLIVPYLHAKQLALPRAIGTSAALGVPIAFAGAVTYALSGWAQPHLPPASLGFIWLPALLLIAMASVLTAPWGARLSSRLPAAKLKRIFAVLLWLVALNTARHIMSQ